jgi:DNA gyrase inhibitor GyrI
VTDDFVPKGEIGVQEIGGGEHATMCHRGHYGSRFGVYSYLCNQWVPEKKRLLRAAPVIEIYGRDIRSALPRNIVTTIHIPLEP